MKIQKKTAFIKEIFTSIQGEGSYVGQKHIFVRFCRCNLNCRFCDTDFKTNAKEFNIDSLFDVLNNINARIISFTGGEPLLEDDFLNDFLTKYKKRLNKKIYLETNGTLPLNLKKIIDFVDIISMDIKLKSSSGHKNFKENEEFIKTVLDNKKEIFIKVVFDKNITEEEITTCTNIAKKYNILLVLQPKMPLDEGINLEEIFEKFYSNYENIRLIAQTHKFLNLA